MKLIKEKLNRADADFETLEAGAQLVLPFETRQKARFVATLSNDQEVGLQLERGKILRGGDKLRADDGLVIEIVAGDEDVSTVYCDEAKTLARVCYHLGNRHVPLQVEAGWCRFLHDHVLNEMVELLGAKIVTESAPFEPEAGAYAHGHNSHGTAHGTGHSHVHSSNHGREHGSHAKLSDESKPSVNSIDGISHFEAIE